MLYAQSTSASASASASAIYSILLNKYSICYRDITLNNLYIYLYTLYTLNNNIISITLRV